LSYKALIKLATELSLLPPANINDITFTKKTNYTQYHQYKHKSGYTCESITNKNIIIKTRYRSIYSADTVSDSSGPILDKQSGAIIAAELPAL
jgi:hypothetical protein